MRARVAMGRQECAPLFLDTGPVGRWLPLLAGPACVPEAKAEAPPCLSCCSWARPRLRLRLLPGEEEEELELAAGVLCTGV